MFLCVYCFVEIDRFSRWSRKGLIAIELRCNSLLTDGWPLIIVRTARQIRNYMRKGQVLNCERMSGSTSLSTVDLDRNETYKTCQSVNV